MKILIVEDDEKVAGFIAKGLREEQFAVDVSNDGDDGTHWALENEYDLILLDIMLPIKDGIAVCREIRKAGNNTPVIMLTAKDDIKDKIRGLDTGADDYMTKPFLFEELLARIRALLRRSQDSKMNALQIADLILDPVNRKVTRAGKEIVLTGKEYGMLEYLMRNMGTIISETRLIEHVWDMNYDGLGNTVNVYLHHLRNKIDKGFDKKLLHTVRGMGYVIRENR